MRIHTSASYSDLAKAARLARVEIEADKHGSRKSAHAFEVHLTGESKRRPNFGTRVVGGSWGVDYAATWDQWGVFLAAIFEVDPEMSCWAYKGVADFDYQTGFRFEDGWPEDAHGDHVFRFAGVPGSQGCTKCSAVKRWNVSAAA